MSRILPDPSFELTHILMPMLDDPMLAAMKEMSLSQLLAMEGQPAQVLDASNSAMG